MHVTWRSRDELKREEEEGASRPVRGAKWISLERQYQQGAVLVGSRLWGVCQREHDLKPNITTGERILRRPVQRHPRYDGGIYIEERPQPSPRQSSSTHKALAPLPASIARAWMYWHGSFYRRRVGRGLLPGCRNGSEGGFVSGRNIDLMRE